MNEINVSVAMPHDSAPAEEAISRSVRLPALVPLEFVGSSDETIAEAVRRALSHASISLRTLDGVGVVVIPQIDRQAHGPRFQVTLRILPTGPVPVVQAAQA